MVYLLGVVSVSALCVFGVWYAGTCHARWPRGRISSSGVLALLCIVY